MNETVKKLVDIAFRDTVKTEEAIALYEQVLADSQERFDDLTAAGMDEDEAIAAVVESLRGLEEAFPGIEQSADMGSEALNADPFEKGANAFSKPDPIQAVEDRTWEVQDISSLQVNLKDISVDLSPSADGRIHLEEPLEKVEIMRQGNTLIFRQLPEEPRRILFGLITVALDLHGEETLRLRVPPAALKSLQLHTVAGNILLSEVTAPDIQCASTSGDVRLSGVDGSHSTVNLSTTSGDIFLQEGIVAQEMKCTSISGEVNGSVSTQSLHLSTTSGDVEMQIHAENLYLATRSGDIDVKGQAIKGQVRTISGDVEMDLVSDELQVASISGDVEAAGSCRNLNLATTSGDLELNLSTTTLSATSVSGDVQLHVMPNLPIQQVSVNTTSGDVSILLPYGPVRIQTRTRAGDVTNRRENSEALDAPLCKVQTVSGDIRID